MVPASLPLVTRVLLGGFVWNACQRKYGNAEKARQRRIVWSVLRGSCEAGRNPLRESLSCTNGVNPKRAAWREWLTRVACDIRVNKNGQARRDAGGNSAFAVTTIHLHVL